MGKDMQPLSRNARIVLSVVIWLFLIPLIIGIWLFAWWLGLGMALLSAWFTYDYIKRGDLAGEIEEGLSRGAGMLGKGATEALGRDDPDDR